MDGPLRVWGTSLAAFQKSFHFAALPIWRDVRLRSACKNARSTVHFCHPAAFAYKQSWRQSLYLSTGFTRGWTSKRTYRLFDMKNCNFHSVLLHLGAQRPSEHPRKPLDSTRCESLVLVTYVNSLRSPKAFVNTGSVFPEQFRLFSSEAQNRRGD